MRSATRDPFARSSSTRAWASEADRPAAPAAAATPPRGPPTLERRRGGRVELEPRPARRLASARARPPARRRRAAARRGGRPAAGPPRRATRSCPAPDRRQRGRAQHRRVRAGRLDRGADRVGLELEHERLVGDAAVDPQAPRRRSRGSRPPCRPRARRFPPARRGPRSPRWCRRGSRRAPPGRWGATRARRSRPGPAARGHRRVLGLAGELAQRRRVVGEPQLAAHPLEHRPGRRRRRRRARTPCGRRSARRPSGAGRPPARAPRRPRGRARRPRSRTSPSPGRDTRPRPASAACWSTVWPAGQARPASRDGCSVPRSPAVSRISGSTSAGTPNTWQRPGSQPGVRSLKLGPRRRRGSVAKPAPRRSHRNESTVPIAASPRRGPRDRVVVLEQPGQLGRREVGVERKAAAGALTSSSRSARRSSTCCERLSCHTTIGVRAPLSASQASTDSPWWSSPRATTSPGASSSSSAIASTTASQHLLAVLLDPPRLGVAVDLVAPSLAHGCRRSSNSAALTPVVPSSTPRSSAPHGATLLRGGPAPPRLAVGIRRGRRQRRRSARARRPAAASSPTTCSPMPSEAERPVERIAATLISAGRRPTGRSRSCTLGRRDAVPRSSRSGRRPRGAGIRRALASTSSQRGADRPVALVVLVVRGRARDHLAVDGREHEHPLRALRRHREQDASSRAPPGGSKTKNSPLRGRLRSCRRRPAGDLVRVQAGAVDRDLQDRRPPPGAAARRRAGRARSPPRSRRGADLGARRRGRRREGERVGDRVGHRLAGDARPERARSTPFRPRCARSPRPSALALVGGARPARRSRTGTPSSSSTGRRGLRARRISSVSSSPGLESKPVCRIPEFVPLAPSAGSPSASRSTPPRRGARKRRPPRCRPRRRRSTATAAVG